MSAYIEVGTDERIQHFNIKDLRGFLLKYLEREGVLYDVIYVF